MGVAKNDPTIAAGMDVVNAGKEIADGKNVGDVLANTAKDAVTGDADKVTEGVGDVTDAISSLF